MYNQPMLRDDALKGKTIVVTGGGTGLGRSMATYFSKLGANLVISSRKLEVLQNQKEDVYSLSEWPLDLPQVIL